MRVAFAGTPPFAARALEAVAAAGYAVPLVLTQPDRPAGRGMRVAQSAVATRAVALGFPVEKFSTLRDPAAQSRLREAAADVLVVAAYGLLLPRAVLDIPPRGCLNIHASLLPRWRGAAPIQRAIQSGDAQTGVCIMRMEEGLDTGPVLLRRETPIGARETAAELTARLAELGAEAIVEALGALDSLEAQPQANEGITYAAKVTKAEAPIDWSWPAERIDRQVRAFDPTPGCETLQGLTRWKVWSGAPCAGRGAPGVVLESSTEGLVVACGRDAYRITTLQRPGGRRLPAPEALRGAPIRPGERLGEASREESEYPLNPSP